MPEKVDDIIDELIEPELVYTSALEYFIATAPCKIHQISKIYPGIGCIYLTHSLGGTIIRCFLWEGHLFISERDLCACLVHLGIYLKNGYHDLHGRYEESGSGLLRWMYQLGSGSALNQQKVFYWPRLDVVRQFNSHTATLLFANESVVKRPSKVTIVEINEPQPSRPVVGKNLLHQMESFADSILDSVLNNGYEEEMAAEAILKCMRPSSSEAHQSKGLIFHCDELGCFDRFKSVYLLKRHKIIAHSGERPYVCTMENCSATFKTSRMLCDHLDAHYQK